LRIIVSPTFDHDLAIDAANPDDIHLMLGDIPCVIDPESAERADGLAIDYTIIDDSAGFRIDNPNRPSPVLYVDRTWVEHRLKTTSEMLVIDTRTAAEYAQAHLPAAVALNADMVDALERMDRRIPLLFYCSNGVRSRKAAERYSELGYHTVYCLDGGLNGANSPLITPHSKTIET
jgi:rhodanese-related sulfurtransferase